jgi:hypothetical protein
VVQGKPELHPKGEDKPRNEKTITSAKSTKPAFTEEQLKRLASAEGAVLISAQEIERSNSKIIFDKSLNDGQLVAMLITPPNLDQLATLGGVIGNEATDTTTWRQRYGYLINTGSSQLKR